MDIEKNTKRRFKMKLQKLLLWGVVLGGVSLTACGNTATKEQTQQTETAAETKAETAAVQQMTGEELNKIEEDNKEKEKYLVIDVRSKEEYDAGHVKHAININVDELKDNLSRIEAYKEKDVVTICNTGKKSQKAADELIAAGFTKVHNAQGVKDFDYTTMTKVTSVLGPEIQKAADEGNAFIIDARDEKDYKEGHLKGAVNITPDTIDAKINEVPKDKPIYVHCYTGNKSFVVADKLAEAGYENVHNSIDGTKEYTEFVLEK